MFRGASSLSMDDKGRFAVPTKYRDTLLSEDQGTVICTVALHDPCLWLYPLAEWVEIESRLAKISTMDPRARRMQRMLLGNATEYQLDKNGRILLAPTLRGHAQLGKKIMLVGLINKFEIWDEARWHEQMRQDTEIERLGEFDSTSELNNLAF